MNDETDRPRSTTSGTPRAASSGRKPEVGRLLLFAFTLALVAFKACRPGASDGAGGLEMSAPPLRCEAQLVGQSVEPLLGRAEE
jgi:hypothetical protein